MPLSEAKKMDRTWPRRIRIQVETVRISQKRSWADSEAVMINGVRELRAQFRNTVATIELKLQLRNCTGRVRGAVVVSIGKGSRRLCLVPQPSDHVPGSI